MLQCRLLDEEPHDPHVRSRFEAKSYESTLVPEIRVLDSEMALNPRDERASVSAGPAAPPAPAPLTSDMATLKRALDEVTAVLNKLSVEPEALRQLEGGVMAVGTAAIQTHSTVKAALAGAGALGKVPAKGGVINKDQVLDAASHVKDRLADVNNVCCFGSVPPYVKACA